MFARLSAFLVWGLLAACLVFWAMQLLATPLHASAQVAAASPLQQAGLDRLFGANAPAAIAAQPGQERFVLLGVVAPRAVAQRDREGLALISVDGQARTVRLGGVVDGDLRLIGVEPRAAHLGHDGTTQMTLQLPDAAPNAMVPPVVAQPVPTPPMAQAPVAMPAPLPAPMLISPQGPPSAPIGITPG
ncbi:MAG: hypothetical protein JO369_03990 [Paucibacter sp.]|nr:hypothetical protein [Roseateles sp.]